MRTLALPLLLLLVAIGLVMAWWRPAPVEPIRIGAVHALSGIMAESEQGLVDALHFAVEELNAAGGVLGRPVELLVADSASDWDRAAAEAERLIVDEQVSALFGCWTSACRKAVKPVVEAHQHLLFYPVQYEGLEASPNIVYTGAAPNQQIIPGVRWAVDQFGPRVFLIGSDYVFPRTANWLISDLLTATGGTVVAERYRPLEWQDFTGVADEIRALAPDVVINTINGASNSDFFAALAAAGLGDVPVVSFSVSEPELRAMPADVHHPQHYAVWGYFNSLDTPGNRAFVAAFRARFGATRVTSDPLEASYNGVHLWATAVVASGRAEPEHVNRNVGRVSVAGPSGVVAVDAATRHVWRRVYVGHALPSGQFAATELSEQPVRPMPFPPYRTRENWLSVAAQVARGADEVK